MLSNHLILCHPLLLLPSIFPSIRVFSSGLVLCIRWPNYWSVTFSDNPPSEYSGLISFRLDWLDLLAVQGCSPEPQFESINFFALSLIYGLTYMTAVKTIALTIQTVVGKLMSLPFFFLICYLDLS